MLKIKIDLSDQMISREYSMAIFKEEISNGELAALCLTEKSSAMTGKVLL